MSITLRGDGYSHPVTSQEMYSDGTPMIKVEDFDEMVQKAHTMVIRYTDMVEFMTAMFLVDAIEMKGGYIDTLILPYVPGARQDRSNPTGDVLTTLYSVSETINSHVFNRVVILDPHSPMTTRLIDNVVVYPQELVAKGFRFTNYGGIIAADKGGRARAEEMADKLGLPVFYGGKIRDASNGRLSGFSLDEIPQGHYLVVDDICDGGGTFIGLGDMIKEQGSTADLFVSHGIFSKGVRALLERYDTIYTTDSLAGRNWDKVTVLPVVEGMESYDG